MNAFLCAMFVIVLMNIDAVVCTKKAIIKLFPYILSISLPLSKNTKKDG